MRKPLFLRFEACVMSCSLWQNLGRRLLCRWSVESDLTARTCYTTAALLTRKRLPQKSASMLEPRSLLAAHLIDIRGGIRHTPKALGKDARSEVLIGRRRFSEKSSTNVLFAASACFNKKKRQINKKSEMCNASWKTVSDKIICKSLWKKDK